MKIKSQLLNKWFTLIKGCGYHSFLFSGEFALCTSIQHTMTFLHTQRFTGLRYNPNTVDNMKMSAKS